MNGDVGELLSEYVCVSGRSEQISAYTAGKNVLGREDVSVFSTALLRSDELSELPDGLSAEPVALQKLFYFLTGGNDAEREKK